MLRRIRSRLTYANVVSTLGLFIALGGVSYAAVKLPKNSVGPAQIKKNAVTGSKVKNSSLTGSDVKNSSLGGGDIRNSSLTGSDVKNSSLTGSDVKNRSLTAADFEGPVQGPKGDQGPAGPKGDQGPATGPASGALRGTYPSPTLADGTVSTPNFATLPAVVVKKPTAQAIGASITVLTYDTEEFDTAGLFNPGTSSTKLTAPVDGIYWVSATVEWSGNVTGRRLLRINRNDTGGSIATDAVQATSAGNTAQAVSRLTRLAAGDFITTDASHTAGGALDLYVQAVSLNWVGP